jgi:hypothetical protein
MRITTRGWARDMGKRELLNFDLKDLEVERDDSRTVYRGHKPGLFPAVGRVFVAWFQNMRHMGDYRMEIEFSDDDVIALFKAKFGAELREWLIEEEGFTISRELTKRALRNVKLTDVTLADLAAMSTAGSDKVPATAEKLVEVGKVTPIRRRI